MRDDADDGNDSQAHASSAAALNGRDIEKYLARRQRETPDHLLRIRSGLDSDIQRINGACALKEQGNAQLAEGKYEQAMRLYLTALWLIDFNDPPVPSTLTQAKLAFGPGLLEPYLQFDTAAHPDTEPLAAATSHSGDLRFIVLLNIAACALKREDWSLAQRASERALELDGSHAKALYRLAKAHEGSGELEEALRIVHKRLLTAHPNHEGASRLSASLRVRLEEERKMYGGLFDKAAGTLNRQQRASGALRCVPRRVARSLAYARCTTARTQ